MLGVKNNHNLEIFEYSDSTDKKNYKNKFVFCLFH